MRKLFLSLALLAGVAIAATQPSWAQNNKFKVFGGASYITPLGDEDLDFNGIDEKLEASDELGWTVGFEWRMIELIGLELDVVGATHDLEFDGDTIAEIDVMPISLSCNFHLINTKFIDFYIAPTATYVLWGDLEIDDGLGNFDEQADDEWAFGASMGLDVGIGKHFAIFGGIRWLDLSLENDDLDVELGVDPLISRLGVAWRW